MPFAYCGRLSPRDKAVYRKSDAIAAIRVPRSQVLGPHVAAIEVGLEVDDHGLVQDAAQALCDSLNRQLEIPAVLVQVLAVRPSNRRGELHGFYQWEPGKAPVIRVWMRTAKQARVVAFRTFLRTLLHEVCHHVDYALYGLDNSFHTTGFFQRESSLVRQLATLTAPR